MISKIRKLSLPVNFTPVGFLKDGLFWDNENNYYSQDNSKSFFVSFPKLPVSINMVKIRTFYDVYPNDFSISVSNDNETWKIILKNASLCDESTSIPMHGNNLACKDGLIRKFDVDLIEGFYSYLKFEMFSNTYLGPDGFENLIGFSGFEIIGKLFTQHKECSLRCTDRSNTMLYLYALLCS